MKRSQLKADPGKTRAFIERSRQRARDREAERQAAYGEPGSPERLAWLQGRSVGREGMKSTGLRAATAPTDFRGDDGQPAAGHVADAPRGLSSRPRRKAVTIPGHVRARVLARTHGGCVMCLHRQLQTDVYAVTAATVRQQVRASLVNRATQLHHVLPQGKWPHLAKVEANLTAVCPFCHDEHERAHRRLPRCVLPPETIALAEAEGLSWYIERVYPA